MSNIPPNPFDNPAFREEFRKEMEPVTVLLAEHDRSISRIHGIGALLGAIWIGLIAWIKR